ncbi:MAG TPA: hypothetical protein VK673_16080 [Chthoniobacterales bacterium]|nr:hypothetical protein [Chthoniobacterales bacterium]
MKILLWLLTVLLTAIPLLLYLAYSIRRLDTRRQLLLENLFTLWLDDDYMRIRHARSYNAWKEIRSSEERKRKFESDYFGEIRVLGRLTCEPISSIQSGCKCFSGLKEKMKRANLN